MILKKIKGWVIPFSLVCIVLLVATIFSVSATTVNVLDGQVSITDSANSNTVSGGTVTITAKGSLFSKKTNNITITNETENKAELTFDYSVSKANSFKIAGTDATSGSSYSVLLDAGASLAITLVSNSGLSNTTATLTLSNFKLTVASDSSNVTFEYDSSLGSVTADGEAVSSGGNKDVGLETGTALVAKTNSGATFLGWVDGDGRILSADSSYTLKPTSNMTVKAVFVGENSAPYWGVGSATQTSQSVGLLGMSKIYYHTVGTSYIFDDLNAAANYAASSNNKYLVLLNSGTLPAGNYTIPAGVTVLIPFDNANTLYTTSVQSIEPNDTNKTLEEFRTLTLADGAKITINGAMSISSQIAYCQTSKNRGGSPIKAASFVRMQGNSNITINSGGTLYAYGFITGSGSVTANSGSKVYECFQIRDFRGGTQTTNMDNGVFPFSQYYIQNIEVPMTLYSGAKEYGYTVIYMSSAQFHSAVDFIGPSSCMFTLTSGYLVKKYDGATDRLSININGDLAVSSVTISVGTGSINTKSYELPINNNLTVHLEAGTIKVAQDVAFLPGSELIVDSGASCVLNSGYNVYVYDSDVWGNYCYSKKEIVPVYYAPGKEYTRTTADLKDAMFKINGTLDASAGYLYTTAGGANICTEGSGTVIVGTDATQEYTYQCKQESSTTYAEIEITPAKLKNPINDTEDDFTYVPSSIDTEFIADENGYWRYVAKVDNIDDSADSIIVYYVNEADTKNDGVMADGTKFVFVGCTNMPATATVVIHGQSYKYHAETGTCTVIQDQNTTAIKCGVCDGVYTITGTQDSSFIVDGGVFTGTDYYVIVKVGTAHYLVENVNVANQICSFNLDIGDIGNDLNGATIEYVPDTSDNKLQLRGYQTNGTNIRFFATLGNNILSGFTNIDANGNVVDPYHPNYDDITVVITLPDGRTGTASVRKVYDYLYNDSNGKYQFVDSYVFSVAADFSGVLSDGENKITLSYTLNLSDNADGNAQAITSSYGLTINVENGQIVSVTEVHLANGYATPSQNS